MTMRSGFKKIKLSNLFKRWLKNDSGNITMIFGFAIIPVILAAGSAIDFERISDAKTKLQASVDSATLYAASLNDTEDATLKTKSQPFLLANYVHDTDITLTTYTAHNAGDSIVGTGEISVKTWFMGLFGINYMTVSAASTVKKSGINLEVSLVLDNTGSMAGTPIANLKTAATNFVNKVMPATQGQFYTKIAAIPYNNGVNLGNSAASARGSYIAGQTSTTPGSEYFKFTTNTGGSQTLQITNCVTERTGGQAYTDAAFSLYPVGRSYLGSGNPCSVQQMVPLTTTAATLNSTINAMTSGGSTAGQVGIAWGWYALSPNVGIWSGASQPATYDKLTTTDVMTKVKKVMILMTDGEYNSANANGVITGADPTNGSPGNPYYGSVPGSGGPGDHINIAPTNGNSYTQSNSMCAAIKASGVEVFVITFQLDKTNTNRVNLVNNCATDSAHILDADTTSLDVAFNGIANNILSMRVSQ
jgi:Flp pilus assembly protein TadG